MKKLWISAVTAVFILLNASSAFATHDYAMSFLFGGTNNQYLQYVQNTNGTLNSVSPDYFDINADGSLKMSKIEQEFIDELHKQNVRVIPFLSNHWDRTLGIAALDNQESLSTEIAQAITKYQLDGINVDIENVSHLHKDQYASFVQKLRAKIPNKIITVSVAANPKNWTVGWHGSYDYTALAESSDYLMIMAYDESFYGGPAGPVASGDWVEKSIQHALTLTTPDKLVLGLPFFGRYWQEGAAVGGHGITRIDIENLEKNYKTTSEYVQDRQSAKVTLTLSENDIAPKLWGGAILKPGNYEIWYDNDEATKYKLDLVNKYQLRGSGSWALGQDPQKIWEYYPEYKKSKESPVIPDTSDNEPATTSNTFGCSSCEKNRNKQSDKPDNFDQNPNMSMAQNEYNAIPTTKQAKQNLFDRGWVSQKEYNGNATVTRGQAIKVLVRMAPSLVSPPDDFKNFNDVTKGTEQKFIKKAKYYGIIHPDRDGNFYPKKPITKGELALYVDRLFNLPDTVDFESEDIKDVDKSNNPEMYYAINKYYGHGVFTIDVNGRFYPEKTLTMDEFAVIIDKLAGSAVRELIPNLPPNKEQPHNILEPR